MKDETVIMATVLQTSTTIASLVLVLQGFLLAALASRRSQDHPATKFPYKRDIVISLVSLIISILVALGSICWLLGFNLFWVTAIGFLISLLTVAILSIMVTVSAVRS